MLSRAAVESRAVLIVCAVCLAVSASWPGEAPGPSRGETAGPMRGRGRGDVARARRHRLSRPQVMNVVDEALYVLAEHYVASGRVQDAVAVLEDCAAATPDAETRSAAYLNLGVICQEKLGDQALARSFFSKVTGRMAATARHRILSPLRREKNWAEAVKFLKECLEHARDPEDRAGVVRQLVQTARSCGDEALMESVLSSVPEMISYTDAQAEAESRRAKMEEARREQAEQSNVRARRGLGPRPEAKSRPWRRKPRKPPGRPPPTGDDENAGREAEDGAAPPEL